MMRDPGCNTRGLYWRWDEKSIMLVDGTERGCDGGMYDASMKGKTRRGRSRERKGRISFLPIILFLFFMKASEGGADMKIIAFHLCFQPQLQPGTDVGEEQ